MTIAENSNLEIKQFIDANREDIISISAKHGAFNIRLFGSVVRGEATSKSDIDFLIDYDIDKISSWFPVGLIHELEALLGRKVDIVPADSIHVFIKERVLSEAIAL